MEASGDQYIGIYQLLRIWYEIEINNANKESLSTFASSISSSQQSQMDKPGIYFLDLLLSYYHDDAIASPITADPQAPQELVRIFDYVADNTADKDAILESSSNACDLDSLSFYRDFKYWIEAGSVGKALQKNKTAKHINSLSYESYWTGLIKHFSTN